MTAELTLTIPFETPRQAEITKKVMEVDKIVKGREIEVRYAVVNNSLLVVFKAENDRILRTVVNSTIESLKSLVELYDAEEEL